MEVALKYILGGADPWSWTQKVLHSCPADKNNSNCETHTQEWWMWWNECENVTGCVCFLCLLSLSGRPLSNSGQLPADSQKSNTCQLALLDLSLPETDTYSLQIMSPSCSTVRQRSAADGLLLDCFVFLNEDSLCCGWGGGELPLSLSPGNIWNRSAGWPGLVLPRLTATHTHLQKMVLTSGLLPLFTLCFYSSYSSLSSTLLLSSPFLSSISSSIQDFLYCTDESFS